jgi:hypothetical protein
MWELLIVLGIVLARRMGDRQLQPARAGAGPDRRGMGADRHAAAAASRPDPEPRGDRQGLRRARAQTFEEVTAARAKAISVQGPADLAQAENQLTQALGKLLAISENYPQLKADANFRQLQEELAHTENMVAGSRGHYNASVRAYDEARKVFPTSVIAGMFNFEDREYFEVDTVEVRSVPNVSFE